MCHELGNRIPHCHRRRSGRNPNAGLYHQPLPKSPWCRSNILVGMVRDAILARTRIARGTDTPSLGLPYSHREVKDIEHDMVDRGAASILAWLTLAELTQTRVAGAQPPRLPHAQPTSQTTPTGGSGREGAFATDRSRDKHPGFQIRFRRGVRSVLATCHEAFRKTAVLAHEQRLVKGYRRASVEARCHRIILHHDACPSLLAHNANVAPFCREPHSEMRPRWRLSLTANAIQFQGLS